MKVWKAGRLEIGDLYDIDYCGWYEQASRELEYGGRLEEALFAMLRESFIGGLDNGSRLVG